MVATTRLTKAKVPHDWKQHVKPKNPYDVNPKDFLAAEKLPLNIVPDSMVVFACLGFLEGAHKYGQYNWRAKPVKMSVYIGALRRHSAKLNAGEWADKKTNVPHGSYILCCMAIMMDAYLCGTLIDDRPPSQPSLIDLIDEESPKLIHGLAKLFATHNPHQYTIQDDKTIAADKKRRKK